MESPHLQSHCSLPSMMNIAGSSRVRRTILAMVLSFRIHLMLRERAAFLSGDLFLGSLLRGLCALAKVHCAVHHGYMRKRLREIAQLSPGDRIVFLSKQADVVGEAE